MTIKLVEVGAPGLEYVKASVLDGLSMGRAAVSSWSSLTAMALVPPGAQSQQILNFRRGGLGRLDLAIVAYLLKETYPDATLFVELPLSRPGDPETADDGVHRVVRGSEVYAICSAGDPLSKIEATLRSTDPSIIYNVLIVKRKEVEDQEALGNAAELFNFEGVDLVALLAGAYDGEGFVLAASHESLSKLGILLARIQT